MRRQQWQRQDLAEAPGGAPAAADSPPPGHGQADLAWQFSDMSLMSSTETAWSQSLQPLPYTTNTALSAAVVQTEPVDEMRAVQAKQTPTAAASPSSIAPGEAGRAAEALLLDLAAASLANVPASLSPTYTGVFGGLERPVAVPRLHGGSAVPFARGYAPCLQAYGIDTAAFLAFIDGLNLVTSPNPAALLLHAAAFGLQVVPVEAVSITGAILSAVADGVTEVVAQTRAEAYLARANAVLFGPRGLHVSIADDTKAMRTVLGISKEAPLLAPLTAATLELATLERCMLQLHTSGWAAALDLEVQTGALMPMAKPSYKNRASQQPSSAWAGMGRSVNHALVVVADKRVRWDIKRAEEKAAEERQRAWKRHSKGKKLKESSGEKSRVKRLSWLLVRNLADVQQEQAAKEAEKAAKEAEKAAKKAAREAEKAARKAKKGAAS